MSSSGRFDVRILGEFTVHGGEASADLPDGLREEIAAEINALAARPFELGREPPSPPFAPVGLFYDFQITFEGRLYSFWFTFLVDEDERIIAIDTINMFPPFSS